MAVTDSDKRTVMSVLQMLGAKSADSAKGVEMITKKCGDSGPRYKDKQLVAAILQVLVAEKKAVRIAKEKAASYYLTAEPTSAPAPIVEQPQEGVEQKSENPYL